MVLEGKVQKQHPNSLIKMCHESPGHVVRSLAIMVAP